MDDQLSDANARENPTLDWRNRRHWGGGLDHVWSIPRGAQGSDYHGRWVPCDDKRKRCRLCGQPTFLRDFDGEPCHKVCAERAIR